jgi:small subunit ribosomal protein S11
MGKKRVVQKSGGASDRGGSRQESKRLTRKLTRGIAHVRATYNNTMVTITDDNGEVLAWSSAGALGYSGAKKSTPFVAARITATVVEKVKRTGIKDIAVRVSGVGSGRDASIRALANQGLNITEIKDITPLPHNGPRAKKVRRV